MANDKANHITGLSLDAPRGDARLDLRDLYVFQSPHDPERTALILTANPDGGALHPDAVYRVAIDNDGDLRNDIAFEADTIREAGFDHHYRLREIDGPEQHAEALMHFLAVPRQTAEDIAALDHLFSD